MQTRKILDKRFPIIQGGSILNASANEYIKNRLRVTCTPWVAVTELFLSLLPPSETTPVWTTVLGLLVTRNSSFKNLKKKKKWKLKKKWRKVSVLSLEFAFMGEFLGIYQFYLNPILLFSVKPLLSLEKKTVFFKALMGECRDWGFRNTLSFR